MGEGDAMKRSQTVRTAALLGGLASLMAVGLAIAQTPPKVGSGDLVADRIRLMRLNNLSLQDMQAKAKADNVEAIAVNGETIAINAMHIPALFPPWVRHGDVPGEAPDLDEAG